MEDRLELSEAEYLAMIAHYYPEVDVRESYLSEI